MLTIYHNPRCRKSREAVAYLETQNIPFEIINYYDHPFDASTLQTVLDRCGLAPSQILRKQEALWKSDYKGKTWTESQLLQLLVQHPKLIERPLVVSEQKGVLARPLVNLVEWVTKK